MAVTTTYALNFVQNLDLTQGPANGNADATSLSNGGFAVSGDHVGHTDLDIFNADASDGGGNNVFGFVNSAADQLSNGNIVIAGNDGDSIRFVVTDGAGSVVVAETDFGDVDSSNADVAALTGGGFWIVAQDEIGAVGGDADIDVYIRNNDGSFAGFFSVDTSVERDLAPSVAGLDGGGAVVTWTRTVGANTQVWYAVYNSVGGVIKAPTLADGIGSVNRNVSVTALNGGGFALVYEDNGWGTGTNDITLARFDSAGNFLTFDNVSNPTFINDGSNDANPTVTRLANGLLVVAYGNNAFGDTDTVVRLVDPVSGDVLATRFVTAGESIADDTDFATLAGFGLGHIAVFHNNLTDGDADGEDLQGVRNSVSDTAGDFIGGDDFVDNMTGNDGNDFLFGANNNDNLNGGNGNDTMQGGAGIDTNIGGGGSDTFVLNTGDLLGAGEVINGGGGGDRVLLQSSSGLRNATVQSIEEIEFGGAGAIFTTLAGSQIAAGLISTALVVDGRNGANDKVNILMLTDTGLNLSNWTFVDWLSGGTDQDRVVITGDNDAEIIRGSIERDIISGSGGNDTLNGHAGSDIITGGAGADRIVFDTALGLANIDRINGFQVNIDEIALDNAVFTALPGPTPRALTAAEFHIGAAAADASDRIIYNAATGALFYDADGNPPGPGGGAAQIRIATLAPGLALDNFDFVVI